ncbi:MAG TPA: hypothetical protein VFO03_14550 [Gaiellaceae bacterium]|nr:hypothetical protein [Gaiellaceae bacterium]
MIGRLPEGDREHSDNERGGRREHERSRRDDPKAHVGDLDDDENGDRSAESEHDRPGEVGKARPRVAWEIERGQRPGARAEAGPVPHADEDERADARGDQAGEQDERHHRAAEAGSLDQDHGADHRRAEDRRDGGEAPRRGHQSQDLLGRISPDQSYSKDGHAHAEDDERRFGAEYEAEAERGERR